jgi:hypothetical protein
MASNDFLETCLVFFDKIGIQTKSVNEVRDCVVPGVSIHAGILHISASDLLYPGDILHEAGHIAVVPSAERQHLNNLSIGARKDAAAEEMMAIAWSYAAALHLNFDPKAVFHDEGYKGGGSWIADAYQTGGTIGVPMLEWVGMTDEFPTMNTWVRD